MIKFKDLAVLKEVIEDKKIAKEKAAEQQKRDEEIKASREKDKEVLDSIIQWLLKKFGEAVTANSKHHEAYYIMLLINDARREQKQFSCSITEFYFKEAFNRYYNLLDKKLLDKKLN